MSIEDRAARDDRAADLNKDAPQERRRPEELVRFVKTKGPPVTGRHRDKPERIAETVWDLELACEGAFSLARRTARSDRGRWGAALARACSVFLRKMVIGDRKDPATRLLDDSVVQTFGMDFDKLQRIPAERQTLEVGISTQRADGHRCRSWMR